MLRPRSAANARSLTSPVVRTRKHRAEALTAPGLRLARQRRGRFGHQRHRRTGSKEGDHLREDRCDRNWVAYRPLGRGKAPPKRGRFEEATMLFDQPADHNPFDAAAPEIRYRAAVARCKGSSNPET